MDELNKFPIHNYEFWGLHDIQLQKAPKWDYDFTSQESRLLRIAQILERFRKFNQLVIREINKIWEKIYELETRVEILEEEVRKIWEEIRIIKEQIQDLLERMEDLENRMDDLESRMEDLEARMSDLEARMDALEERMTIAEGKLSEIRELAITDIKDSEYISVAIEDSDILGKTAKISLKNIDPLITKWMETRIGWGEKNKILAATEQDDGNGNIILTQTWVTPTPNVVENDKYTVTFLSDQPGVPNPPQQEIDPGGLIAKPEDPVKENYTFLGWFYGTRLWNFDTDTVSGNMVLKAAWYAENYTELVFDWDAGEIPVWNLVGVTSSNRATVDWGDGSPTVTYSSNRIRHTYAIAGRYTVKIFGEIQGFFKRGLFDDQLSRKKLKRVNFISGSITDFSYGLYGTSLENGGANDIDTSNITNMFQAFGYAENLVNQDLSKWNTSRVINTERMFYRSSIVSSGIGSWDTSRVTNFKEMFLGAQISEDLSGWDVSSGVNFSGMFRRESSYKPVNIGNISNWNMSNANDISWMFGMETGNYQTDQTQLTIGDLSGWDLGNVVDMTYFMASAVTSIPLDVSNWNTRLLSSANYAFAARDRFYNQMVGVSGNFDKLITSNLSNASGMFRNNTNMKDINLSVWDASLMPDKPSGFDEDTIYWTGESTGSLGVGEYFSTGTLNGWAINNGETITGKGASVILATADRIAQAQTVANKPLWGMIGS